MNYCNCIQQIPRITKDNDFRLSLHMTETMCDGSIADLTGATIESVILLHNGTIRAEYGEQEADKITYEFFDNVVIVNVFKSLPIGKYGITVKGKRNIDDADFCYNNEYVFEIVKYTKDAFIPCDGGITYSVINANVGLATSTDGGGGHFTQIQSDWNQSDSTKVDFIKNKPNVYVKPNTGIPKTDLASDVQTSLNKANTAIQSLNGYATQQWVQGQGYLTQHQSLDGYATQQWVQGQGYLTQHQSLDGYATQQWVNNQGYLTQHQSLDGYATQQWVTNQGYLTQHQDISGKEDKMPIAVYSASTSSIQLQMAYNRIDFAVGTMTFTLPSITSSDKLQGLIVAFTTDTTPAITVSSTDTVIYAEGSNVTQIEAGKAYEMNAIYDGVRWKITLTKFVIPS